MKRGIFFISVLCLFLFLIFLPLTGAVSFDMKANYSQGETLMAKISGTFIDVVSSANVFFYREGYVRVPIQFEISKLGDSYYLYAQLSDKTPGNYSISIENVRHTELTTTSATISQNFSIISGNADFSVTPGFVSLSNTESFSIDVKSLANSDISLSVSINNISNQSSTLSPSRTEQLSFSLSSFVNGINYIQISDGNLTYNIPVYAIIPEKKEIDFSFEQDTLNITLGTNQSSTRIILLRNTGKETLNNIKLYISDSLKPYINLSVTEIPELAADASAPIQVLIPSRANENKIQGNIRAEISDLSLIAYSQISLNFVNNFVSPDTGIAQTCSSVNGKKCNEAAGESCNGYHVASDEGVCCLGTCEKPATGISGTAIAIIIIVLLLGGIVFFLIRRKKKGLAKGKGTPLSGVELLKLVGKKK